jgi:hypothetical protein
MMKPRKEERSCRKQVATFVFANKVYRKTDYRVQGNWGKIGKTSTQALLKNKRNLFRFVKSREETNSMDVAEKQVADPIV